MLRMRYSLALLMLVMLLSLWTLVTGSMGVAIHKRSWSSEKDLSEPPIRPPDFKNADEVYAYLKELREYYDVMARPR